MLNSLFNIFFQVSLTLWVGAIAFFSFVIAPGVFRELPREMAGDLISKLFPQYYYWGYLFGIVATASLFLKGIFQAPFPAVRLILLLFMLGCSFYAGVKIHPQAHLAKTVLRTMEDGPEKEIKQKEFSKLHRESVILNSLVLLSGLLVLILTAYPKNS